jgi:hypothetical protein
VYRGARSRAVLSCQFSPQKSIALLIRTRPLGLEQAQHSGQQVDHFIGLWLRAWCRSSARTGTIITSQLLDVRGM